MTGLAASQAFPAIALPAGLGLLLLVWLRRAGYGAFTATALVVLTFAQPAFLNVQTSFGAALFAGAVAAVAAATVAFVRRQDARRIVLLGGSLAGAQLVNPIWGAAATVALPLALRRRLSATSTAGLTGMYVSILFVPILTAAAIFAFDASVRSELWSIVFLRQAASASVQSLAVSILPSLPLLLALSFRASDEGTAQIAAIALAILTVSTVLGLVGTKSPALSSAAGFGALSLVLIGTWKTPGSNLWPPFLLAGANSAVAWVSMFAAQGHV